MVTKTEALSVAEEAGLDLVQVSFADDMAVCKIMDFGKYRYEMQKRKAEAKKKQKKIQVKEVKFRPNTDVGDYQVKLRNLKRFLEAGDKAKITIRFRGREMAHLDLGRELLERLERDLDGIAQVEQKANVERRQMSMVVAPIKK